MMTVNAQYKEKLRTQNKPPINHYTDRVSGHAEKTVMNNDELDVVRKRIKRPQAIR